MAVVGLALAMCASLPVRADPSRANPAATLSAVLGGTLDPDVGEAGALNREVDWSSIALIPGRSVEYRRRVALETQPVDGAARKRSGPPSAR